MYILLAIVSVILLSTFNIVVSYTMQKSRDSRAFAALFQCLAGLLSVILFMLLIIIKHISLQQHVNWSLIYVPIITVILYGIVDRIKFDMYKYVAPSILTIITSLSTIISMSLSFLLYKDVTITFAKFIGTFIVFATSLYAGILITKNSTTNKKIQASTKGIVIAFIVSILWGITGALDKLNTQILGLDLYNVFSIAGPFWVVYLFPPISLGKLKQELQNVSFKNLLLSALLLVSFYYIFLIALQSGPAYNVLLILSINKILTFIFEIALGAKLRNRAENLMTVGILAILSIIGVSLIL